MFCNQSILGDKQSYTDLVNAKVNLKQATDVEREAEDALTDARTRQKDIFDQLVAIQKEEEAGTFTDYNRKLELEQAYEQVNAEVERYSQAVQDAHSAVEGAQGVYEQAQQNVKDYGEAFDEVTLKLNEVKTAGDQFYDEFMQGEKAGMPTEAVHKMMDNIKQTVEQDALEIKKQALDKSREIYDAFSGGKYAGMPSEAYGKMLQNVKDKFLKEAPKEEAKEAGEETTSYYVDGGVNGIDNNVSKLETSSDNMTTTVNDRTREGFGVHSPSTITEEMGMYYDEGFALGVTENEPLVLDAITQLCTDINEGFATAMTNGEESAEGGEGGIFGGLLNGFKTACTSIIDYVTGEFVPLLTETFTTVFGMEGESGGVFEGMYTSFQTTCQKILEYIPEFTTALTNAFATAMGGSGEMSVGGVGMGMGGGLFGGMLTSFQMACQQIIDYVLMTFVPLLTTTFQTAFGGGMGMGGMGMMGGGIGGAGIGGAGIGGGVGGMGMGMDGMSGGLFGGLFMNFQMTCQMMIDYITATFIPMLTEALLAFVESFQTDILDVLNERITEWCDLLLEDVITPFIENTLEMFEALAIS